MIKKLLFTEDPNLSETEEIELQRLAIRASSTPPLTPLTAYLKAREELGGLELQHAREALQRLDKQDKLAERALNDFEERIERGYKLGKILPNNAITLKKLHDAHQKAREAYNDAARRYEARIQSLRTEEARNTVRTNAEKLLNEDRTVRHTLELTLNKLRGEAVRAEEAPKEKINQVIRFKRNLG